MFRTACIVFGFITLGLFQNCTNGFQPAHKSSSSTLTSDLSILQKQALEIMSNNCRVCHVNQALGGVSNILDFPHLIDANLIIPGNPDGSPLYMVLADNSMPPSAPLSAADKLTIRNWIQSLQDPLTPPPLDLRFTFKLSPEPTLFRARLAKLASLMGSAAHTSLSKLKADRLLLGDYDFSAAIIPKESWEATDMKAWVQAIEPVCASTDLRSRFPWSSGASAFVTATLGRQPSSIETGIIQDINQESISDSEKFDVLCITILSSLEYVTK